MSYEIIVTIEWFFNVTMEQNEFLLRWNKIYDMILEGFAQDLSIGFA